MRKSITIEPKFYRGYIHGRPWVGGILIPKPLLPPPRKLTVSQVIEVNSRPGLSFRINRPFPLSPLDGDFDSGQVMQFFKRIK